MRSQAKAKPAGVVRPRKQHLVLLEEADPNDPTVGQEHVKRGWPQGLWHDNPEGTRTFCSYEVVDPTDRRTYAHVFTGEATRRLIERAIDDGRAPRAEPIPDHGTRATRVPRLKSAETGFEPATARPPAGDACGYTSRYAVIRGWSRRAGSAAVAGPPSNGHTPGHYRLRYDQLDPAGRMTIRRAGRMHHLPTGAAHARKRVLAFADDHHVTVTDLTAGEVLSIT